MNKSNNDIGVKVSEIIKKLRRGKGMTRRDLQLEAGVSSGYITKIEERLLRSPTIAQLELITKALKISLVKFFKLIK